MFAVVLVIILGVMGIHTLEERHERNNQMEM
jgi:hypothetical protein